MPELALKEFLVDYGESLANKVVKTLKVVHDPLKDNDPELDIQISQMKKRPFPPQAEIIKACYKSFSINNHGLYMVAECGTGKTIMSIGVAKLMNRTMGVKRVLVLCPPTIVKKWITEIRETISNVKVVNLNTKNVTKELIRISKTKQPTTLEFYVIGRERAKIGAPWRPAAVIKVNKHGFQTWHCPRCNKIVLDQDDVPVDIWQRNKQKRFKRKYRCVRCGEQLWQPDNSKPGFRRVIPAKFINNRMNGFFDLLIADEVHQFKNHSGQGYAFGALASACKYTLCLTGTLVGGYASDVYNLLYRTHPKVMNQDGNKWGSPRKFIERYGTLEKIKLAEQEDGLVVQSKKRTYIKEKPGINPVMITNMLLPHCVFMQLSDCINSLQTYDEKIIELEMDPMMAKAYKNFEDELKKALLNALATGDNSLLGSYINSLLTYTERIQNGIIVTHPYTNEVVATGKPVDGIMPKEEQLAEIVLNEKQIGRRVLLYYESSGETDISDRLIEILEEKGVRIKVLKSGNTEKRAEIIQGWVNQGVDVVLTNPRKVEVGMDLMDFPTIIFYQIPLSTYTLRQASRRSWRIPQKNPVHVYFFVYTGTMQSKLLQLMANKLMSSMSVEGDLSDQGLNAMANIGGNNLAKELAKMLIENVKYKDGSLKDLWISYRKSEVKSEQLLSNGEINGKPVCQTGNTLNIENCEIPNEDKVLKMESSMEQIGNCIVKVRFTEYVGKRKKKVTHVEVTQDELDKMITEAKRPVVAQLSLF